MLLRQLLGLGHHCLAPSRRGGENDLCPQHAHDLAALHRERLRHDGHEGVTLGGAYHGKRDTGVAGGCLHDRLSRLERSAPLSILDDRDGEAIFHRAQRIEEFALHIHRDVLRSEPIDAHDRSFADGAKDAFVDHVPFLRPAR